MFSAIMLLALLAPAPVREFIYETAPFPSCHAATMVETAPGEFLAAWFGGTDEGSADVAIWGARLADGRWTVPVELAREAKIATYNPVLFYAADRTLWLYYKFGPSPSVWTAGRRFSRDNGKTWSPIEHLPAGLYGPIKNKPLLLPDGAIVSGTSVESYRSWSCWVERSTDNGRNWTRIGPITVDTAAREVQAEPVASVPGSGEWGRTHGIIQPAVVPLGKRLRMYVRATQDVGRICFSDSSDGGLTWSAARPTTLPNPNSGIDAVGLRDGRIVLVYNHTAKGRSPLNVAVSADGDHWNMFQTLESERGEFSYPAVIQASNGDVHIVYTWNRKKIRHVVIPLAAVPVVETR